MYECTWGLGESLSFYDYFLHQTLRFGHINKFGGLERALASMDLSLKLRRLKEDDHREGDTSVVCMYMS